MYHARPYWCAGQSLLISAEFFDPALILLNLLTLFRLSLANYSYIKHESKATAEICSNINPACVGLLIK